MKTSDPEMQRSEMQAFKHDIFRSKPEKKTILLPVKWERVYTAKKPTNEEQRLSWMIEYHNAEMTVVQRKELKSNMAKLTQDELEEKIKKIQNGKG